MYRIVILYGQHLYIISRVAMQSIEHKRLLVQACCLAHQSIGRSKECTVAKWLIGSGWHLKWWVGLVEGSVY